MKKPQGEKHNEFEERKLEELYQNFKKTKSVQITMVSEDEEKIEMSLDDFKAFIKKVYEAGGKALINKVKEHRYGQAGVCMVDENGDTWIKADPLLKDLQNQNDKTTG